MDSVFRPLRGVGWGPGVKGVQYPPGPFRSPALQGLQPRAWEKWEKDFSCSLRKFLVSCGFIFHTQTDLSLSKLLIDCHNNFLSNPFELKRLADSVGLLVFCTKFYLVFRRPNTNG